MLDMVKKEAGKNKVSRTMGGILIPRKRTISVNTIFRAANILICLSNGVNTITDIASQCQLSKSSVHHLLKCLEEPQLVVSDSINHRYHLGPLVTQLASNPQTSNELLIATSLPEMENLSEVSEETISLVIMMGTRIIMLREIPSKHGLKVTDISEGLIPPSSLGATQKVLLSQLSDEELSAALLAIKEEKTAITSTKQQKLLTTQLKQIRKQGYAISYGERIPGGMAISAPIKNYTHPTALSIVGPESRFKPKSAGLTKVLLVSAEKISKRLAGSIKPNE
jgi:DNA-binding IclR family transcriptional regulator